MANIDSLLSSNTQHYCTPEPICEATYELYRGWPDLDPATNSFSKMRAKERWTVPFDLDAECEVAAKRLKRHPAVLTSSERYKMSRYGRAMDEACKAQGIKFRDATAAPWPTGINGFYNPPYNNVQAFMAAREQAGDQNSQWLALIVSRTSAKWFHRYCWRRASALLFFEGRLSFELAGQPTGSAPFDSVLVYYGGNASRFKAVFNHFGEIVG